MWDYFSKNKFIPKAKKSYLNDLMYSLFQYSCLELNLNILFLPDSKKISFTIILETFKII